MLVHRGAFADPEHTLPRDIWDPSFHAYLIAWGGHALLHDPAGIWQTNAFYPAPYSLAFSDSLLGYAPFGLIGTGPDAAVLRYNLVYIGAYALVLFGGYALARQLGLRPGAATLVGVALAVAPWRLSHTGHLNVLSTGGIYLAFAMLARGHGVRWLHRPPGSGAVDPPRRPGWAFAGWVVAAWQVSLGFAVGLPFLYLLLGCALVGVVIWAIRHRADLRSPHGWRQALPPRPLLVADAAGGLVLGTVSLLLALPYLRVLELYPQFRRSVAWVELYSPPVSGLFIAPQESSVWGAAQAVAREGLHIPGEMARLPGFALYALAAVGLFWSAWRLSVRIGLALGAIVFAMLTVGTNGPGDGELGYLLLLNLPGFDGIRTPGRMIVWTTLLLALLAGGAVGAWGRWIRATAAALREEPRAAAAANSAWLPASRPDQAGDVRSDSSVRWRVPPAWGQWMGRQDGWGALARVVVVMPAMVVFLEGLGAIPHAALPPAPPTLSIVEAPYLVLPLHEVLDTNVVLWSTDRFAPLVNGGTSQTPPEQNKVRELVATFPDEASVAYLREIGVRSVVALLFRLQGTPLADAATIPIDGLPLTRQVYPDAVVFSLDP